MVSDFGAYFDSYYGTIVVFGGSLEITGGWHFTTDKANLVGTENDIEPYGVTLNEREPNDSQYTANIYTNDADMYGTISRASDIDYYKVTFGRDGKANFFLGNIPKDCNYNLKIYYQSVSGGSLYLYRTLATSGSYEQVLDLPIESDKVYYMQVYSSKGSSTTEKYQVRAKITATTDDDYEPNNSFATAKAIKNNSALNATIHKAADVDYYVFDSSSNGVLTITLSNIPSGCDYRFIVYDQDKKQIDATGTAGSGTKSLSVAIGYGKYYIKVYSASGSTQYSKYRLNATNRSSYTTISGYIRPDIKTSGNSSIASTAIADLPIQIVYKPNQATSKERILANTTTNSIGWFSSSFSLPNVPGKLFVKTYPSDSKLSIVHTDDTISTSEFEVPFATANISFDTKGLKNLTEQMRASMSLWRLGKKGLATYNRYGLKQLSVQCTVGQDMGTSATSEHITVNGLSDRQDYYDYDILLHEMGHWILTNLGGRPTKNINGITHTWSSPSATGRAYFEGWAHYFSCSMRNEPTIRDYDNRGYFYGGNLQTGKIQPDYKYGDNFVFPQIQSVYTDNEKMEIFIASSLWNLTKDIGTTYQGMEDIAKTRREDWEEFYNAYMGKVPQSKRKDAWEICEKFHVAYDKKCPEVTLTIRNLTAYMGANDDVSIESYEWYVDNVKKGEGSVNDTSATSTLDLKNLNLTAGTHTVECRVYDPEGLKTGSRPRKERYKTTSQTFVIPSVSTVGVDMDEDVGSNWISQENPIGNNFNYVTLPLGTSYSYPISTDDNMDIEISINAAGAVKTIEIYLPNGDLYDSLSYIASDTPYVIKNAVAGEWMVIINNYSENDLLNIVYEQGGDINLETIASFPDTKLSVDIVQVPATVDVDVPLYTSNPYILKETFGEESIIVTEDGQQVDIAMPLSDGAHQFTFIREVNGLCSEPMEYSITVDTIAPEITVVDFPSSTNRDRCLLQALFSEDVKTITINGEEMELNLCGGNSSYTGVLMLDSGINCFSFVVTDHAGNSNYQTLLVERMV